DVSYMTVLSGSVAGPLCLHSFPTRRSSDLGQPRRELPARAGQAPLSAAGSPVARRDACGSGAAGRHPEVRRPAGAAGTLFRPGRSEEHTSELQSRENLVCRLLLEKKKKTER